LGAVIMQGGISGAAMPMVTALQWEIMGRGVSASRRGLALSLAYGFGPLLAVVGSMAQTAVLGGSLFGWLDLPGMKYPNGFILLFGAGAPVVALAGLLSQGSVLPSVSQVVGRAPVRSVLGLLTGIPLMFVAVAAMQFAEAFHQDALRWIGYLSAAGATLALIYHFRDILGQPVLFAATLATVLVYMGNMIPSNMNLYTQEVLGELPEKYAGLQNTIRFGFKVTAGLFLGWFLTRTNPRAGILVTSGIFLTAQLWAIFATGTWYLLAFGIYGAGELIGVYAPNYILSASRPHEVRRNMAFVTMLMAPAAPAGYIYGAIADFVKDRNLTLGTATSQALGFRASFAMCALLIASGMLIAWRFLPPMPQSQPHQSHRDENE